MERIGYFDHDADIGIVGRGATRTKAFEAAAEALFGVCAELSEVKPISEVQVELEEEDPELALVEWLNGLLAEARIHGLQLCRFELTHEGHRWRGRAWGETWRSDIARGTEVKGATLTGLAVREIPGGWEARCVVDV